MIDVILPVRDCERYLGVALKGLLEDGSLLSRILVIDDGSSDRSAEVARSFGDSRISVIQQPPLGLVAALNRGISESKATFVARMDADDISLPGRFAAQLEFLRLNPKIALVGTQADYIDSADRVIGNSTGYPTDPGELSIQLIQRGCVICHPTILARREAILNAGGYRGAFEGAEDYDLWLRMSETHELANLPATFLRYRWHESQVSATRKLRQGFSRDLALICAWERRAGRRDPSATLPTPPPIEPEHSAFQSTPQLCRDLVHAYRGLIALEEGRLPVPHDLSAILRLVRMKLLGEGRRTRSRALKRIVIVAMEHGRLRLAGVAFLQLLAKRIEESRLAVVSSKVLPNRVF
jgi:hypothetical protein